MKLAIVQRILLGLVLVVAVVVPVSVAEALALLAEVDASELEPSVPLDPLALPVLVSLVWLALTPVVAVAPEVALVVASLSPSLSPPVQARAAQRSAGRVQWRRR